MNIEKFKKNITDLILEGRSTVIRIFERERCIEDFSVTFTNIGKAIHNFSIKKRILADGSEVCEIKKTAKKASSSVYFSDPPEETDFVVISKRNVLCIYFKCDVFYGDGTRRFANKK